MLRIADVPGNAILEELHRPGWEHALEPRTLPAANGGDGFSGDGVAVGRRGRARREGGAIGADRQRPRPLAIAILSASAGPRNIALANKIADGWLPLYMSLYRMAQVYGSVLEGFRKGFEIACPVQVGGGDDLARCLLPVKMTLAFSIGGMGHRTKNFSKEKVARMGYAAAAERVQQSFLAGQRGEGIEVVPDALADEIVLCGPPARIRESLMAWRATPVATPVVMTRGPTVLRLRAEATSRG